MKIKSIRNAKKITGKRVFLRVDFNVPTKDGGIEDDYKIVAGLPTIRFLLRYNCKVIIATHLGRPDGKKNLEFSTEPVARRLGKILDVRVLFADSCVGFSAGTAVGRIKKGEIVFLENLRFEKGEEKNEAKFAKELSSLADIYVNDAFAASHRKHASVSAIKEYLPSYAGLLLAEEVKNLEKILKPRQPLISIIGGSKISTKISFIKKIRKKSFKVLIGGALANNFFVARKFEVGESLIDKQSIKLAKNLKQSNIILPIDVVVSKRSNKGTAVARSISKVDKDETILDIGPKTIRLYASFIKKAQTIVWNGPMGMFEKKSFKHGTLSVARLVAARSRGRAFGVAGGGETITALKMTKMEDYIDWVSTGGGAMLTYLGGEPMPGLKGIVKY